MHRMVSEIAGRLKVELAAQIADVGIDAAIVGDKFAAKRLLGHHFT